MATITIYDPPTRRSKTVNSDVQTAVIQQDQDGVTDYFITLTTFAFMKNGQAIPVHTIRRLTDLARGTSKQKGTGSSYADIREAVEDHVLNMIEGDGGDTAMDFTR